LTRSERVQCRYNIRPNPFRSSQFVQTPHLLQFTYWLTTLPPASINPNVYDTLLAQIVQEIDNATPFIPPVQKLLDCAPLNPILPKNRSISSTALREATSEYDLPAVISTLRVASVASVRPAEVWDLGAQRVALNKAREGKWEEARR